MGPLKGAWSAALAGLLCVGGCSGASQEAPVPGREPATLAAGSAPPGSAGTSVTTPVPAGGSGVSVPAGSAEGRPGGAAPPPRGATPPDSTVGLRQDIERLIGDAACQNDSQCRVLPLGAKACGGPEAYVAWSTARTDARQLEALAARYKEARVARNQRLGLVSDCSVVPEPPVRCVPASGASGASGEVGRCQTGAARTGPLPATR